MSKSFMWVLCIGEKKTSVHSIQCHCQGRLVLSSINYCLKKCLGKKKRKKECRLSPNMYCIYVLGYPSYFQIKKVLIIINDWKIICQIKSDYLCFAIFLECVFDVCRAASPFQNTNIITKYPSKNPTYFMLIIHL